MDVDLLRPGTVPISPDTILWFEFLLKPELLKEHLRKSNPDPSPTDLIIKFLSIHNEQKDQETKASDAESDIVKPDDGVGKRSLKNLALKILSLKIAAFLKWDLDVLENKLPLPMQVTLLHDLQYLAQEKDFDLNNVSEVAVTSGPSHLVFAVALYNRWVLRAIVHNHVSPKQNRQNSSSIPGLQDSNYVPPQVLDELMHSLEKQAANSIAVLNRLTTIPAPLMPTPETFNVLTEDSASVCQNWAEGITISDDEFHCQLHFDLAQYHFFREDYHAVQDNISKAATLHKKLVTCGTNLVYCTATAAQIKGYSNACEMVRVQVPTVSPQTDLLHQLHRSIRDQYTGIVSILQADNVRREIPLVYRATLELDIQGALSSGKFTVARDLLLQVQTLNVVRKVIGGEPQCTEYIQVLRHPGTADKAVDMLISALKAVIGSLGTDERHRVKIFILHLIAQSDKGSLLTELVLNSPELSSLFTKIELKKDDLEGVAVPELLLTTNWNVPVASQNKGRLPAGMVEQQLISTYDPKEVKDLIVKLGGMKPIRPLWKINPKWDLPIPLKNIVSILPRGSLQDFSYIIMAKARELVAQKDYAQAIDLLSKVEQETKSNGSVSNNIMNKVTKLISWEVLLVQIIQFFADWPHGIIGTEQLIAGCKQCLAAIQSGESVVPRVEVQEQCMLCLLNLGQWDYLVASDKRWTHFELPQALAAACQDVIKYKGTKKVCKDAWDIVLPVFGPSSQQKRSSSGASVHRDSPTMGSGYTRASLHQLLMRLREPTVLSVALSLLARLHNVLKDDNHQELSCEHVGLWPAVVSNSNSYHSKGVAEMLSQLLLQALKYHPNNVSWLKLVADLCFVLGHYKASLSYYLKAAILVSDFFSQPLPRAVMDDLTFRRMIKCCSQLQCHTQAAVLCQFLEETDYATAFKSLGDVKSSSCSDSMDSYYNCIWDITILEFLVHLHSKRGEHQRKHQAMRVLGLLELNANNNKEIQREAANLRKSRFLRALARQFVC